MNNTVASNNTQHGVYLENIRNYVIVNASSISYNGYGAGLCVYGGAGTNWCSRSSILVPLESSSAVLVMICSKSVSICNRSTLDEPIVVK